MDQLAIYNIYSSLKLYEKFEFSRGGDLLVWYNNKYLESSPDVAFTTPAAPPAIAEEIINFDKGILKEISGVDVKIGLSDFVSVMSQPPWVWNSNYDFPRLYSWSEGAKQPIFSLFNYDLTQSFRGNCCLYT